MRHNSRLTSLAGQDNSSESVYADSSSEGPGSKNDTDNVDWDRVMSYRPSRNTARHNYMSQFIGTRISCRNKGCWRTGVVSSYCNSDSHTEPTWIVTFTDDGRQDQIRCNEQDIRAGAGRWGNQASILNLQLSLNPSASPPPPPTHGSPASIAHLGAPPPPPPPIARLPRNHQPSDESSSSSSDTESEGEEKILPDLAPHSDSSEDSFSSENDEHDSDSDETDVDLDNEIGRALSTVMTTNITRRASRSLTRSESNNTHAQNSITTATSTPAKSAQCRTYLKRNKFKPTRKMKRSIFNFHDEWDNSSGDLDSCEVRPSKIAGAGLGLFATKHIKAGQRATKYSGTKIGRKAALSSKSSYIVEVHTQLYLDADGPGHMAGRYLNDGPLAGIPANARLGSSRRVYKCKKTGRFWIPVIAIKNIKPGDEIVIYYGKKVSWTWPTASGNGSRDPSQPDSKGKDRDNVNDDQDARHDENSSSRNDTTKQSSGSAPNSSPSTPHQHSLSSTTEDKKEISPPNPLDPTKISLDFQSAWKENLKTEDNQFSDPMEKAESWYNSICKAIKESAKLHIPMRGDSKPTQRNVSERTKALFAKRASLMSRGASKSAIRKIRRQIKNSSLQDYKDWLDTTISDMEAANMVGDTKKIFRLVNFISGKPQAPPINLTKDGNGNLLNSEEVAATWYEFLKEKFAATPEERSRAPLEPLPDPDPSDHITRKEFDAAVKRLKSNKATGPDGIPAEAIKYCPAIQDELFQFLNFIWTHESVPVNLAQAEFKMLFKGKGSPDDPSKYRCIGLLNHAYKLLAHIILARLLLPSEGYLQDWQAGFRANRGCRDNSMVLRTICDEMIKLGEKIAIMFVDYSAAFDTVSHKFIDRALKDAGASNKVRAMFRAVYSAATAFATAPTTDGKKIKSPIFEINRGVLQGDITSPIYFILALELILRLHDQRPEGVSLLGTIISTLGYADDLGLLNYGDEKGLKKASERITAIAIGSRKDADMKVSLPKTKVLHVRDQDPITATTTEEAISQCKHECPNIGCSSVFASKKGLNIHKSKCEWTNEYEVEKIVGHKGPITSRKYKISWKGYNEKWDTWEPRSAIHPQLILDYEKLTGIYDDNWPHRCDTCGLPCKSDRGVKIHKAKMHKPQKAQSFKGRQADRAVQLQKLRRQQKDRPSVLCENEPLENVFSFKYLGSMFNALADQTMDVKARIARAMQRCGQLRHILDSDKIEINLKLRLYEASVCSLLTFGCETWTLNKQTLGLINGANSRMLARFTGKSIPAEARPATCSLNLIRKIRQRRLRWVGHILRQGPGHIIYTALAAQSARNLEGNLLMDAPPHTHLDDLTHLAMDRASWGSMVSHIPAHVPTRNKMNSDFRRSNRLNPLTMKSVSL